MSTSLDDPRYLLRWDFSNPQAVGRDLVLSWHRLAELSIGSDTHLETLLRSIPRGQFSIHCMGEDIAHPSELQTGSMGVATVDEAIEIIRGGRLSMTVRQIDRHDSQLANIAARLVRELCECHVGLRILDPHLDLHISSPGCQHYYSCDASPSVLWHLRGQLKVLVYPRKARFLNQRDFEHIIYQGCTQPLYYEPAFDSLARVTDVTAGQMIAWPHPSPYRIEAVDGLSVSLRLTFQTPAAKRQRNIHLANRVLRRLALDCLDSDQVRGFWASAKNLYAEVMKLDKATQQNHSQQPTFVLDPSRSTGVRMLNEQVNPLDATSLDGMVSAGISMLGTTTPTAVLEN